MAVVMELALMFCVSVVHGLLGASRPAFRTSLLGMTGALKGWGGALPIWVMSELLFPWFVRHKLRERWLQLTAKDG